VTRILKIATCNLQNCLTRAVKNEEGLDALMTAYLNQRKMTMQRQRKWFRRLVIEPAIRSCDISVFPVRHHTSDPQGLLMASTDHHW
jgi:hypothetical protein